MDPASYTSKRSLHSRCQVCGCPLQSPLDQMHGVCNRLSCRGPFLLKKRQKAEQEKRDNWIARCELAKQSLPHGWIEEQLESSKQEGRVHYSVVPNCPAEATALPEERRRQFATHLDSALEAAAVLSEHPSKASSALTEHEHRTAVHTSSVPLPVINGCSTCRGYCCKNGREHAFLDASFLAWQLLCDPTATIQSLRKAYISQLPEYSVESSCVFHGVRGCVLPRTQRSNICNEFHCYELQDALDQDSAHPPSTWVAFSSAESGDLRVGIMRSSGRRTEHEFDKDGLQSAGEAPVQADMS
jgi:hypothetical protein